MKSNQWQLFKDIYPQIVPKSVQVRDLNNKKIKSFGKKKCSINKVEINTVYFEELKTKF